MMDLLWKIIVHLVIVGCAVKASVEQLPAKSRSERRLDILRYDEDTYLTARQLIEKYGYRGETHMVTTEDGYILEMHRITGPNSDRNPEGKQPILIMHGLLSSSIDWLITGPGKALGYILADEKYDVWMGNVRGNFLSRKHTKYTTLDKEYWQFSWHEIGMKDIPALIDYILEKTSKRQLIYAAHSQGTTAFWVMASERPEYQKKVKAMFALAPVAYLKYTGSPIYQVLSRFGDGFGAVLNLLGWYEFEAPDELLRKAILLGCDEEAATQPICMNIIFLIAGKSYQLNETMIPTILGHIPAGASVKQIVHYSQLVPAGKFQQYDYGMIGNLKKYKKLRPPVYDLSKIMVPVHLHYGTRDMLSDLKDIDRLYKELGNPIGKFRVPSEKFGHIDFLWANNVKQLVYDKMLGMMEKYRD